MLLTYFLNDFEMVPVAPIITDITLVFTFHMRRIIIIIIIIIIISTVKFVDLPVLHQNYNKNVCKVYSQLQEHFKQYTAVYETLLLYIYIYL
jgi:hypothetical protein